MRNPEDRRSAIGSELRIGAAAAALILLAACQPGSESAATDPDTQPAPTVPEAPPRTSPLASAFYVTEFSPADVRAAREAARFAIQTLSVDYSFTGNPLLTGVTILQNAFEAARVEYAHSVGLTGAGQIVAINDSTVDFGHVEFAGKRLSVSGDPTTDVLHGTAVASVLLGTAEAGEMMGVAPGAELHVGQLDFTTGVTFRAIAERFDAARNIGAIASSNSWNLVGRTYAASDYTRYLTGDRAVLLTALRNFAQSGVIVFGVQNDFAATSVNELNGLPIAFPDLQPSWIAGMSAVPYMQDGRILSAQRQSAPCNEAAPFCLAANGTVWAANAARGQTGYSVFSGTSFVAPQIAGAIAILAEAFPHLTAQQLRDRLLVTADNSWFTPEAWVEFEEGLVHGYNSEFGHGFIDLRAALLPIGQVAVPLEGAAAQPITVPIVVSGGASGDAITRALAAQGIMVTDTLGGAFTAPAASLTAQLPRIEDTADQLYRAMELDQQAALVARHAALSGAASALVPGAAELMPAHSGAADFAQLDPVDIPFAVAGDGPNGATRSGWVMRAYAPRSDDDSASTGLALLHRRDTGSVGLEFGLEMTRAEGSMLGIYVPGAVEQMHTDTLSVGAGLGWRVTPNLGLRARAEWGIADGPGAGVIDGFDAVRFTTYEIGLDTRGLLARDDALSLSLRAPLAIASGTADLRLATGIAPGGAVSFGTVPVGLAPEDRQIDLAVDYLAPLGAATSLGFGLRHSWNHGHIAGETALNAVAVLQHRF
jgi:subtilisin family serine protease